MNNWPARIDSEEAAIGRPTATARRLVEAYLAELHDAGRASSSASMAVAAACFRAKLAAQPTPAGERTARVLAGYRRTAGASGAPRADRDHDADCRGLARFSLASSQTKGT